MPSLTIRTESFQIALLEFVSRAVFKCLNELRESSHVDPYTHISAHVPFRVPHLPDLSPIPKGKYLL